MTGIFQEVGKPRIYAYTEVQYKNKAWEGKRRGKGLIKVGYTTKANVADRIWEQFPTKKPINQPFEIILDELAIRSNGSFFTDKDVHRCLREMKCHQLNRSEWFECTLEEIKTAILSLKTGKTVSTATESFAMRPEQAEAVRITADYFTKNAANKNKGRPPHFLWNAKMRFGKTFTSYKLAQKMGWTKILVLTFKPAVQGAWEGDLKSHVDFENWQFISRSGMSYEEINQTKPFVWFASFQDVLGKTSWGSIKPKNETIHTLNWDCIIFDEYHFGAWRESAKDLFESEDSEAKSEKLQEFEEEVLPLTTNAFLYLSGTPFRALANGDFLEDQIFNWTYADEQRAKLTWKEPPKNPYAELPQMVLMTYKLPAEILQIALQGEFNQFDLNEFFKAHGDGEYATFKYENEVSKWLKLLQGQYLPTNLDALKMHKAPPMPFSDSRLWERLQHTFWFLPNVSACYAMGNLLKRDKFFNDYKIIVCAGSEAGIGLDALTPVETAIGNALETRSITLSCGKLATGVTVKPWSGIFMLRNTSSPETYFQAAFRVQSPWVLRNSDPNNPHTEIILKKDCYIFDFAPDRALSKIAEYSGYLDLNSNEKVEKRIEEFIQFLPVLCYDGYTMKQLSTTDLLDMTISGTSSSMLARRWECASLVNVDNATLQRLLNSEEAMLALQNIEGFRSLNKDLQTIIAKSEALKKIQREKEGEASEKEKKEISKEERDIKKQRDIIRDKLIKFATRIPIFMYLTDYREETLKDVITQLEPSLFQRVTGLEIKDFELLCNLNVFNSRVMNSAILAFKRYEDASLEYANPNLPKPAYIGAWDTKVSHSEYINLPIPTP